ncbi:hypothetical protein JZ751_018536 [Albula glossodonta]|uniref:FBX41/ZN365 C2H2-type zinc finger domain-containing protein n=1 Tax=Albula glossodonta TaxID=121402 RepID=A0A8T2NP22_9TELE|nr:hypothetical protein JZ751_018536 [Albula glossodonta]
MQQKISLRNVPLCKEIKQLPFRCPRCGEHERFRSLSSLRAHLDHSHTYHTLHDFSPASRWRPVEAVDQIKAWDRDGGGGCTERCKRASIETRHLRDSSEKGRLKLAAGEEVGLSQGGTGDEQGEESPQAGALVKRRLGEMLRAADSSMEKRLHRVSSELAHTDSEILRQRVRSEHLAQEKQELFEREKALSRQVDTAVMVIATLREQLTKCPAQLQMDLKEYPKAGQQVASWQQMSLKRQGNHPVRRAGLFQSFPEIARVTPPITRGKRGVSADNRPTTKPRYPDTNICIFRQIFNI